MATLLDGNVIVALAVGDHVHPRGRPRLVRRLGRSVRHDPDRAGHARHRFWPDDRPYDAAALKGVVGHRQVTDAYLAGLARENGGHLATFDKGLAVVHEDVAVLLGA